VRPTAVRIERPVLQARIAPGATVVDPFAGYRAALGPIADALVRDAAGTSIAIDGGELAVTYGERRMVSLSGIEVAAEISTEAISATVSAAGDSWRTAQGSVRLIPGTLAATAQLKLSGVRATRLFDASPSDPALRVSLETADLTLDVATDGRSAIRGSITGSAPRAAIARAGRTLELGAVSLSLDASRSGDALVFGLRDFRAGDLIPGATGTLRTKADGTAPALELQVPALDLQRAGAAALALAGDLVAVRETVEALQRGTLHDLTLNATARDLALLADPSALRVTARLDAATVAVPAAGIVVKNGSGRFSMVDGVLQASELTGGIGRSSFSSGVLAVALVPRATLRSLRGNFEADLADALAITHHLLRGHAEVLAGIEMLHGRTSAAIDYEAARRASPLVVHLNGMQATGRYRGVPLALAVSRGDLHYAGDAVSVSGLAASGRIEADRGHRPHLGREPAIRAASGQATLVLDEIYPLIASLTVRPMLGDIRPGRHGRGAPQPTVGHSPRRLPDFDVAVTPGQLRLTSTRCLAPTLAASSVSVSPARCNWKDCRHRCRRGSPYQARRPLLGARTHRAGPTQGSFGAQAIAWRASNEAGRRAASCTGRTVTGRVHGSGTLATQALPSSPACAGRVRSCLAARKLQSAAPGAA
jgi:hypothetical protein